MKGRFLEKLTAIVCALALALGVMGSAVFAREVDDVSGPADQAGSASARGAEGSDELALVSGELGWESVTPTPGVTPEVTDNRTEIPLLLDGEPCGVCPMIGGVPWTDAAAFFRALGLNVDGGLSGETFSLWGDVSLNAPVGACYVECGGRYLLVEDGVRLQDGQALLPIDLLAKCAGVSLRWDRARWTVSIQRDEASPLASGEEFYDESDVFWLSRLISAETGSLGLSMTEQIAVGDVILNRVDSEEFPDQNNVYDAIFAKNAFDVVINGMVYMDPDPAAVIAAKLALEGYDLTRGATFYDTQERGEGYECRCHVGQLCLMTQA